MNIDPCEKSHFYSSLRDSSRFNVQAEQRCASEQKTIPPEIKEEIEKLDSSDLLILQYPMWWHLPPAMLKGWYDSTAVTKTLENIEVRYFRPFTAVTGVRISLGTTLCIKKEAESLFFYA